MNLQNKLQGIGILFNEILKLFNFRELIILYVFIKKRKKCIVRNSNREYL
jgi:hypothetical protein